MRTLLTNFCDFGPNLKLTSLNFYVLCVIFPAICHQNRWTSKDTQDPERGVTTVILIVSLRFTDLATTETVGRPNPMLYNACGGEKTLAKRKTVARWSFTGSLTGRMRAVEKKWHLGRN